MHIAFRTDSSLQIGTGHLTRCLTLADELARRGHDMLFICRELAGNINTLVRERGHRLERLPIPPTSDVATVEENAPAHAAWLGVSQETDATQTAAILDHASTDKLDWLVVDHYALDARWETHLRSRYVRLMVIDDLADRPHACDLLLDQNFGRMQAAYAHLTPSSCEVFVGPQYSLLRPEFATLRKYSLERRAVPQLNRLLINLGGVDRDNSTGQMLEALKQAPLPKDCCITVVMGPHAPWLDEVSVLAEGMPLRTQVLVGVQNIAELMAESDLAIGAAGSTSWERCALGLPTLIVVLAENQREVAELLDRNGVARLLELGESLTKVLFQNLDEIRTTPNVLKTISKKASELCDGQGTRRIIHEIVKTYCN